MYLVDTSVWVDYLAGRETPAVELLDELLDNPLAVFLCDQIYLEILQEARDQAFFKRYRRYFSGQQFCGFEDSRESHARAAQLYFDCRRSGITIRSSIDCLIAHCALENKLTLLHNDRDYLAMQPLLAGLRQRHFLKSAG